MKSRVMKHWFDVSGYPMIRDNGLIIPNTDVKLTRINNEPLLINTIFHSSKSSKKTSMENCQSNEKVKFYHIDAYYYCSSCYFYLGKWFYKKNNHFMHLFQFTPIVYAEHVRDKSERVNFFRFCRAKSSWLAILMKHVWM